MADKEDKKEKEEEQAEEEEEENEEDTDEEEEAEEAEEDDTDEEEADEDSDEDEEDEDDEDEDEDDEDESDDEDEADEGMGEDVEVPEKFADIVEEIEEMPVVELNELVSLLEKKWGVSAQAVATGGGGGGEGEDEEKDAYDVELTDFGDSKISVIKAVKAALGLGLKEAKGMVEDAPVVLKEGMDAEEAEELKENIEEEGGTVELK
jgi:large subunit ribosomal protein L7/L12